MTAKTRGTASQAAPRTGTAGSRLRTTTIPLGTHGKAPHNSTQVAKETRWQSIDKGCYCTALE